jgi:hypothetical protein
MLHAIEVEIDTEGRVHLLEPLPPLPSNRELLTLLTPELVEIIERQKQGKEKIGSKLGET